MLGLVCNLLYGDVIRPLCPPALNRPTAVVSVTWLTGDDELFSALTDDLTHLATCDGVGSRYLVGVG